MESSDDDSQQHHAFKRPRSRQDAPGHLQDLGGLERLASSLATPEGEAGVAWAKEAVLTSAHLLTAIFAHLCLEDLCRCAMVRGRWREVTSNPDFWRTIDLKGRTVRVDKVRRLLSQHSGVHHLNARGVPFSPSDIAFLVPQLTELKVLELDKGGFDHSELEALSGHLPKLRRLTLAGGLLGSHLPEWGVLAHPRLQALHLESARAVRLRINAPQLTSLSLCDFSAGLLQLQGATALQSLSVRDCTKLTDGALRGLLCLDAAATAGLPVLTSLELCTVPSATDDTLRLVGQRHPVQALHLKQCAALTGSNLAQHGSYSALRRLSLETCDLINGANLSDSVHEMRELEELRITGCAQVTALRLHSLRLQRVELCGVRALQDLDMRCARLQQVTIQPLSPGLAACHALKRIYLASHAVELLQWSSFPQLATVRLQCPNLRELDLSECRALKDAVFESLGSGQSPPGYLGGDLNPGCPQLRVLKLGDCEALRTCSLASTCLESLHLSQCRWLESVRLDCPMLTQLALEECTNLAAVALKSRRMRGMSLGTCPRLGSISVDCGAMAQLDLRGCNQLHTLDLACPGLRTIDATFCSSLSDTAIQSMARCGALEDLVLAVCSSVTSAGLGALSALHSLRRLDLSYTPLEDPAPIFAACGQLTALALSNNFMMRPEGLVPLLGPPAAGGCASPCATLPPLPHLRELDISYCPMPEHVLAALAMGAARLTALSINGCRGSASDALWPLLHRRADQGCLGSCTADSQDAALGSGSPTTLGPPAVQLSTPAAAPADAVALVSVQPRPPHALRSLSMVGSKGMRAFYLGLAPAPDAAQHCLRVTGAALAAEGGQQYVPVATPLEGLHELRLSLSGRLRTLGLCLPQLTDLQLNNCCELAALVLHCPRLERLSMQACKAAGQRALLALVARCPALQELDLQYCRQVTPEVVAALRAACPSLRTVLVTPLSTVTAL